MAQFVSFSDDVEVTGAAIMAVTEAIGDKALPILEKYSLDHIDPDEWYSQQDWLDAFRELSQGDFSATLDLVSIGMRIPEVAVWPPDIETVGDALRSIDEAYHMNHQGGKIGHYRVTHLGEGEAKMVCDNPYPCDFDYGIVYATARLFLPEGRKLAVVHDNDAPCRKQGSDSCTYHISW